MRVVLVCARVPVGVRVGVSVRVGLRVHARVRVYMGACALGRLGVRVGMRVGMGVGVRMWVAKCGSEFVCGARACVFVY